MFDSYISLIDHKISEEYDKLLKNALEPYGIDEKNVIDEAYRVAVIHHHSVCDYFQTSDDYYIDGTYAFSIQKIFVAGNAEMKIVVKLVKGETK